LAKDGFVQFAAGTWLFGLLGLPLLWFALRLADRRGERRARTLLGDLAVSHREGWNPRVRSWRRFLFLSGIFWLLVALARPQWGASEVTVSQRGRDIVIALDISNSMLAEDEPPNRLERAKAELREFIGKMEHGRIGLVLFAGAAFVQCPLTTDYATADMFLDMAAPDMISTQGTNIAAALQVSREMLLSGRPQGTGDEQFEAALLVTDGEDLEGGWEDEVQSCREEGVIVIPVGIGKDTGGLVPRFDARGNRDGFMRDPQGNVVMSRFDAAALAKIGELGGSQAFRIGIDGLAGERLRRVLSQLGEREFEDRRISAYQERFRWPLGLALACFVLRAVVGARRPPRAAAVRTAAAGALALLILGSAGSAEAGPWRPDGAALVERGREHYAAGQYAEALADFQAARALDPEDARLSLAVGEALHRLQRYEEAGREFDRAVSQAQAADLQAEGLYNAGTNALASGDAQRATDLLRRSLRLDPNRTDALTNLELAMRQQQQQQQQQDQKDKQKDNQKDDQKKDEQQKQDQQKQDQQDKDKEKQDQQSQDQQNQDQQNKDQQNQDQQDKDQQKQDQQEQQDQKQADQKQPDQPKDQAQEQAGKPEGQPDQQQIDQERALQILKALDRDEEELKRSVQQRLRGGKNKSGKTW
jgi:Ca-activated chloride channel homolog